MSWPKRRGPSNHSPAPNPPLQMYNPSQHSTQEAEWQQPQQTSWYNTPQQQLKQEPTSQSQTNYWQQPYPNPSQQNSYNQNTLYSNQYQGQVGYYHNSSGYDQQAYGNLQYNQQYNQNNVYPTQPVQQREGESWNWGWGDEDNSNVQPVSQQGAASNRLQNNLGDSFANDTSWNWSLEDNESTVERNNPPKQEKPDTNELFPKVSKLPNRQLKTEKEPELSKPHRGKLNTPQWSTESQVSQESSDDILHTSESDKSHMISRSSTISHSPISGQDMLPVSQSPQNNFGEISVKKEPSYEDQTSNRQQFENKEIINHTKQDIPERPSKFNGTPPPPRITQTPPSMPALGGVDDSTNPYKRITGLSHKSANKFRINNASPPDTRQNLFQPDFHNQIVNLETLPDNSEHPDNIPSSASAKTLNVKVMQLWPENNEAPINDRNQYLETGQLSDVNLTGYTQSGGSNVQQETSDILPPPGLRRMVPGQMEQNENVGTSRNFRNEPPAGLSRMVLGQTEIGSTLPTQGQEDISLQFESVGPPEGLHRMVPGESSSPESSLRQTHRQDNDSESEFDHVAQHSTQPRSATIGADTPPSVQISQAQSASVTGNLQGNNRSETIGGDTDLAVSLTSHDNHSHIRGASASSNDSRTAAVKVNSKKSRDKNVSDTTNRRESIEGQTNENEISNLTNFVRNLTVGENLTDGQNSNASLPESALHRSSRQESSDSESDRNKSARASRDKRSMERSKKEKEREKRKDYSPDYYKENRDRRDRRHKERRYEEDTDYYSDKEKDRRARDNRDYERKYNSLRKEKDKRRRVDPRDYPKETRRGDYYYNRYDDDYNNENRSRPSSRSDSVHESYRERRSEKDHRDRRPRDRDREREKDRYRHRDHRDVFNPYQGFAYDPYSSYYQQYQYFENLRRTNPQAYAEWYRKYYQQTAGSTASYTGEDRASVHSGRSSANDELTKDRYTRQSFYSQASVSHLTGYYGETPVHSISGHYGLDNSSYARPFDQTDSSQIFEDPNAATQRLTPVKFVTAHVKASVVSGKLVSILPNYPLDGQNAVVEVCNLHSLLDTNDEYNELNVFPGPLVRGVTHKKTIIEYCESKIRGAAYSKYINDVDSYVLMWELLILLIRQNGMVVGTDIAELLLKNRNFEPLPRPSSVISSISSNVGDVNLNSEASNQQLSENMGSLHNMVQKEEEIANKFREYLLYGSGKEALEWAMKHGLWGHALFLASKLDKRTYANVMMRFANGLTLNDPLQTLYQLLSGKMPAAVTCVSDEKWGDWRPHLAMILSNSTQRPELNCRAITTLGDTLFARGSLYAAQFCYLMAEVGFGRHDHPETRLVLLGSDHTKLFPHFATNEAIHMTEVYEYACSLNVHDFVISDFLDYKYLLATRLADRGLLEKALLYLEKISEYIVSNPSAVSSNFVDHVFRLADKLKFYDPVGDVEDESEFGGILETSRPDNSWLKSLKAVQKNYHLGLITHQSVDNSAGHQSAALQEDSTLHQQQHNYEFNKDTWEQEHQYEQQQQPQEQVWQPPEFQQPTQPEYQQQNNLQPQQSDYTSGQYQEPQSYWPNQQQQWADQANLYSQESIDQQLNSYGSSDAQVEDMIQKPQPQISMPNQSKNSYDENQSGAQLSNMSESGPMKVKPQSPKLEKTQGTGWFGGIFSKLALKPKNQMKLPDDKNPKIVWDQEKKRWVNVDEDPSDPASEVKPPPKMRDLMSKMPQVPITSTAFVPSSVVMAPNIPLVTNVAKVPPAPSSQNEEDTVPTRVNQPNMFKLQRGRNLKNSYVDIFNPSGKMSSGPTSLPGPDKMPSTMTPQMNFFIPQPVNDPNAPTDFLTPAPPLQLGEQQTL